MDLCTSSSWSRITRNKVTPSCPVSKENRVLCPRLVHSLKSGIVQRIQSLHYRQVPTSHYRCGMTKLHTWRNHHISRSKCHRPSPVTRSAHPSTRMAPWTLPARLRCCAPASWTSRQSVRRRTALGRVPSSPSPRPLADAAQGCISGSAVEYMKR